MLRVEEHVPLATLTTFKTGGRARFVLSVSVDHDLEEAALFAEEKNLPLIPLGDGSNILAPDKDVDAVFVRMSNEYSLEKVESVPGGVEITVCAGYSWDLFVAEAVSRGLWGIENLSSIPGTVGAAAVQNIGAYGMAFSESVVSVSAYDFKEKHFVTKSNAECQFGYRTSIFKKEIDRYFITRVQFRLRTDPSPRLTYRDVGAYFSKTQENPTIENIRNAIITIRKAKFPPLVDYGTAGSFFLNPVLSREEAHLLEKRYPGMPVFVMPEGGVKIPLAWILDHVLGLKGARNGKAFLWGEQPLVIASEKGATTNDILSLMEKVRDDVFQKTGICVSPEVRILSMEKKNI